MLRAVKTVKLEGQSLRSAAIDFEISLNTLRRYSFMFTLEELQSEREMPSTVVG